MSTTDEAQYGYGEYGDNGYGGPMTRTTSITVTLNEEGELTVQVNDDTGSEIDSANVSIENSDASFTESGTTDSTGQVVLGPIPIQDYTVTVSKTGYFTATVSVASGDFT